MAQKFKKPLSLEEKQSILSDVDDGIKKKSEIAAKYGIPRSTLSTILKNRYKIEAACVSNKFEPNRKRMRLAKNEEVEIALMKWISEIRSKNRPLTGDILQEKALFFADAFGVEDFQASSGWLQRFKDRHGIVCKKICGEENSVNSETVDTFLKNTLPLLLKKYKPCDIYNADETGLFWKALPDRTLHIRGQKCSGGKCSKERLTVLVACNMDGSDKLPLFVIGKSKKPRCFKNVKTLPLQYDANKTAWMTELIFTEWLKKFDKKLNRENRKICLILDNCAAHNDVPGLKAIKLEFLPPNTTSKLQPCDQGIIRCIKLHYRKEMIKRAIISFDKSVPFQINMLDALTILRNAWKAVTPNTITRCFKHSGFMTPENADEVNLDETNEILQEFQEAEARGIVPQNVTADDYVNMDDDTLTSEELSDSAIIDSITNKENDKDEENDSESDDESNGIKIPTLSEATTALDTVHRFLLGHENSSTYLNNIDDLQLYFKKCRNENMKQTSLMKYVF